MGVSTFPCTNWTRLVLPPVLSGHVSSLDFLRPAALQSQSARGGGRYYNHLLPRARFLLYAYSRRWPSPEMAAEKMQLISRLFEPLQAVESNHNLTVSLVMRNRNRDL